jgi:hypothetical protein
MPIESEIERRAQLLRLIIARAKNELDLAFPDNYNTSDILFLAQMIYTFLAAEGKAGIEVNPEPVLE